MTALLNKQDLTAQDIILLVAFALLSMFAINVIFTGVGPVQATTLLAVAAAIFIKCTFAIFHVANYLVDSLLGDVWFFG